MKKLNKAIFLAITIFASLLCKGQTTIFKTDTISYLTLKSSNFAYPKTTILYSKYTHDSILTSQIIILQENKIINSIKLPIADIEVKNFSISKIIETQNGFSISTNWGGGNNIYDTDFKFEILGNLIYLTQIAKKHYGPNTEVITKNIDIKILLNDFDIYSYLKL